MVTLEMIQEIQKMTSLLLHPWNFSCFQRLCLLYSESTYDGLLRFILTHKSGWMRNFFFRTGLLLCKLHSLNFVPTYKTRFFHTKICTFFEEIFCPTYVNCTKMLLEYFITYHKSHIWFHCVTTRLKELDAVTGSQHFSTIFREI